MSRKLTSQEREEIRALFNQAAELQAAAILAELKEAAGHE